MLSSLCLCLFTATALVVMPDRSYDINHIKTLEETLEHSPTARTFVRIPRPTIQDGVYTVLLGT